LDFISKEVVGAFVVVAEEEDAFGVAPDVSPAEEEDEDDEKEEDAKLLPKRSFPSKRRRE